MFSEALERVYNMKTDRMSSGEVLKAIYKEEEKVDICPCYLSPHETGCALILKDIKAWLFLNPSTHINTYAFRKQIGFIAKKYAVTDELSDYPTISIEQIENLRESLTGAIALYDKKSNGIFSQIFLDIFGGFDESSL